MKPTEWTLADASRKLHEVLSCADREAQVITERDRRYVVLEAEHYRRLAGDVPTLKDLIRSGPSLEHVDLRRDASSARELGL